MSEESSPNLWLSKIVLLDCNISERVIIYKEGILTPAYFRDIGIFLLVVLKNMRDLNTLLIYGTKAVSSSTVPVILRILLSAGTSMVSPCLIQVPLISAVPLRHIAMTND